MLFGFWKGEAALLEYLPTRRANEELLQLTRIIGLGALRGYAYGLQQGSMQNFRDHPL